MANFIHFFRQSGIFRALRHRQFATYYAAHAVSVLGLWIQRTAIQWLVWDLSGSFAWLGFIALAEALCATVFSVVGGPLADRFDRAKLASLTQALLMVVAAALALVTYLDLIGLYSLMAFVVVTGAIEGIWTPVRLSIIPNMVPREDMPAAVALTALIFNTALFLGPAIGGLIIAFLSIEGAFAANAISYIGLVVVFMSIKITNQGKPVKKNSYFSDLTAGMAYVRRTVSLRTIVMFAVVFSLFMRPFRELLSGFTDEILLMGAEGFSALFASTGFGAMLGAFVIAGYGRTKALVNVLGTMSFGAIVFLFLFAYAESLWFAMITVAGLSLCVTVFGTAAQMMVQMSVDDSMRGRVMSLWQAQFRGVPTLAAWGMGLLEPLVGLRAIFIGACALFFLFMVVNLRHRRLLAEFER